MRGYVGTKQDVSTYPRADGSLVGGILVGAKNSMIEGQSDLLDNMAGSVFLCPIFTIQIGYHVNTIFCIEIFLLSSDA